MNDSYQLNDFEFADFDSAVVTSRRRGRRHSISTSSVVASISAIKKELERLPLEDSYTSSTEEETESENHNSWSSSATEGSSNTSTSNSTSSCPKLAPSKMDVSRPRRRRSTVAHSLELTPAVNSGTPPAPPRPADMTHVIRERRSIRRNKSSENNTSNSSLRRLPRSGRRPTGTSTDSADQPALPIRRLPTNPEQGHIRPKVNIRRTQTSEIPATGSAVTVASARRAHSGRDRPQRRASLAGNRTLVETKDTAQLFARLGRTLGEK